MATLTRLGFSVFSRYDGSGIQRARKDLHSLARENMRMTRMAATLAPAAIPLLTATTQAATGAAAAFSAAAIGTVAWGLAMRNAAKQTVSGQQNIAALKREVNQFGMASRHALSETFAKGVAVAVLGLHRFQAVVRPVNHSVNRIAQDMLNFAAGPGMGRFVAWVGTTAPLALDSFWSATKNLGVGLLNTSRHLGLFSASGFLEWLTEASQRFRAWSESPSAVKLGAYFRDAAPRAAAFASAVLGLATTLTVALGPAGSAVLAILTPMLNVVAGLVERYPGLTAAIWATVLACRALSVGVAVLGAGMLRLQVIAATLNMTVASLLLRLGAIVAVATGAGFAMQRFQESQNGAVQSTRALTTSMMTLAQTGQFTGAFWDQFKAGALSGASNMDAFRASASRIVDPSWAQKWIDHPAASFFKFISFGAYNPPLDEARKKFGALDGTLASMIKAGNAQQAISAFGQMADQLRRGGLNTDQINKLFPHYRSELAMVNPAVQQVTARIQEQNNALVRNTQLFANSEQQLISFRTGLAELHKKYSQSSAGISLNTEKGRENRQQILNTALSIQSHANKLVHDNAVTGESSRMLQGQKDQLIQVATRFFGSRDAARKYIDRLVQIPKSVDSKISVNAKGQFSMYPKGSFASAMQASKSLNFAGGGRVYGSGTDRSDSVTARLSRGEFVVNAKSTRKHLSLLRAINDKGNQGTRYVGQYAGGGLIDLDGGYSYRGASHGSTLPKAGKGVAAMHAKMQLAAMATTMFNTWQAIRALTSGGGGWTGATGNLARAVSFARSQHGKPYQWGGDGNPSWDCSGFLSAIESVIRGQAPHRRWSTHAFQGGAPGGWVRNLNSPFMIGVTHAGVGHTAGTLMGMNVESSGSKGVWVGSSARGYADSMFPHRYGFHPARGMASPILGGGNFGGGNAVFTSFWDAQTASGKRMSSQTIASSYLPLGSRISVNIGGRSATGTIEDLGPAKFVYDRHPGKAVFDLNEVMMQRLTGMRSNVTSGSWRLLSVGSGRTLYGKRLRGYANGGFMSPGETAIVGERGPELATAGRHGMSITPNLSGGSGGDVHIHFEGANIYTKDRREFENMVVNAVRNARARNRLPR